MSAETGEPETLGTALCCGKAPVMGGLGGAGGATLPAQGRLVIALAFAGHAVPVPGAQLRPCSAKAATDNMSRDGGGCVPIKFYLQQQGPGQIPSARMWSEAHLCSHAAPPQAPSPHRVLLFPGLFLWSARHRPAPSLRGFCLPPRGGRGAGSREWGVGSRASRGGAGALCS